MNSSKSSSQSTEDKPKTYKREVAVLMLLCVFVMAFMGMLEALAILTPPVFLFAMGVFGLDWASRQTELTQKGSGK